MAIQAHGGPPFCDNGLMESCFHSQQQQFCNQSQGHLLVHNSKPLNSPPTFALQFQKQWEDIDHCIKLQNENLRLVLQEHVAALVKKLECRSLKMLRQKDEEIAQAAKKRAELEEFLTRLEAENQAWQKVAREKESMALSLYKSLEEMKERACYDYNNGAVPNDAESCCDERREERMGEFQQITREMMLCKSCHSRTSCFLFLPCRHLSSCKACDAVLKACPVCRMPKKASIEILIF